MYRARTGQIQRSPGHIITEWWRTHQTMLRRSADSKDSMMACRAPKRAYLLWDGWTPLHKPSLLEQNIPPVPSSALHDHDRLVLLERRNAFPIRGIQLISRCDFHHIIEYGFILVMRLTYSSPPFLSPFPRYYGYKIICTAKTSTPSLLDRGTPDYGFATIDVWELQRLISSTGQSSGLVVRLYSSAQVVLPLNIAGENRAQSVMNLTCMKYPSSLHLYQGFLSVNQEQSSGYPQEDGNIPTFEDLDYYSFAEPTIGLDSISPFHDHLSGQEIDTNTSRSWLSSPLLPSH
ncbi:hypothetical protein EDC04DRAFT_2597675 [Pisolithus marmoratus]|nr:hypothetical protein EDC04DRAFT_2597675 [Pisolithus marmoratus]